MKQRRGKTGPPFFNFLCFFAPRALQPRRQSCILITPRTGSRGRARPRRVVPAVAAAKKGKYRSVGAWTRSTRRQRRGNGDGRMQNTLSSDRWGCTKAPPRHAPRASPTGQPALSYSRALKPPPPRHATRWRCSGNRYVATLRASSGPSPLPAATASGSGLGPPHRTR